MSHILMGGETTPISHTIPCFYTVSFLWPFYSHLSSSEPAILLTGVVVNTIVAVAIPLVVQIICHC